MNLFYCKNELTERPDDVVCFVSKEDSQHLHLWGERRKRIEFVLEQCDTRIYFGSICASNFSEAVAAPTVNGGIALDGGGFVKLDNGSATMLFDQLKWLLRALYEMTPANRMLKVDDRLIELILCQPNFDSNNWVQCYQDLEPVGNELFDWLWITTDDFELRSKELSTAFRKIYGQERFDLFFQLMVNIKFSIMRLEEVEAWSQTDC